ncbi:translational GTPase TypA [Iamia majanohamensis]|uniref:Large ribosomal subunit assembly factor BipA n=1 Tax=Iamia majanohamensis TaxID=467976 RepID=A0AAF0BXP3_9ACTN|nr:translational GTPase TypA [Iamia majanohamensis]WCO69173.1 translational GTPase TypA [Iamia majanohamensis]
MTPAPTLRNVALVAHVDHGKTTLVDALLRTTGVFRAHQDLVDRVMDSNDQERERGITILAKAAAVRWGDVKINLVDTPGHADFGGEVERALALVDGIVLLVDAAEGPLPQTRYVLSKALALRLPTVLVINKVDRQDARAEEVLSEVEELFLDLATDADDIDFPIISAVAREGRAMEGIGMPDPDADLTPLLQAVVDTVPAPVGDPDAPLQAIVTNLDASDYLGRLAVGRVVQGTLARDTPVALLDEEVVEGAPAVSRKPSALLGFEGIGRVDVDAAAAGDLFVLAGFPEVEIGDTFADPSSPVALPRLSVDEPVLRMTFGVNTSPLSGRVGRFVTSRQLRERLDREVLGNVSIRVSDTDSPDVIEVAGRGELQLAVLIESMRREGYELQVSRPEVIVKEINGRRHEPLERGVVDVPSDHVGTITQALAPRKGQVTDLAAGDAGRTIVTFEAPARGLVGFRGQLLTATRGTALLHTHHAGWVDWVGELPRRQGGAMLADRQGATTSHALDNLQLRGELFVGPGVDVYEGMVIGEGSRGGDMVVNAVREKQQTNIRTHSHDDAAKLAPPRVHTLETAIEWIADDELVEVTPDAIRIRKRLLAEPDRRRAGKRSAAASA